MDWCVLFLWLMDGTSHSFENVVVLVWSSKTSTWTFLWYWKNIRKKWFYMCMKRCDAIYIKVMKSLLMLQRYYPLNHALVVKSHFEGYWISHNFLWNWLAQKPFVKILPVMNLIRHTHWSNNIFLSWMHSIRYPNWHVTSD